MMYLKIKRSFDILFSFIMILLLLPVLFVISVVIKFECPNCGIIFKQKRYGKNSEAFVIYKFRTMKKDAPNISACEMVINQDKYITKFGKFLRKTSLDELPQLFNILKGDMSIIGPRPVRERPAPAPAAVKVQTERSMISTADTTAWTGTMAEKEGQPETAARSP